VGGDHGTRAAQLRQDDVEKLLSAKAWLDGHEQHHVDFGKQVLVGLDGRARVDRQARAGTGGADSAQRPHRSLDRLGVDGHAARARLGVPGRPAVRILDHQVAVDRCAGVLEQRLDDRQPEREVRHEVVVHDVDVQPVGGAGHRRRFLGEPGEVGGQDAGRDLNTHGTCESKASTPESQKRRGMSDPLPMLGH
jgi:hypothetical protein